MTDTIRSRFAASKLFATLAFMLCCSFGAILSAQTQTEQRHSENEYRSSTVTAYSPTKQTATEPAKNKGTDLTSAIEKSVDYLQKQIAAPSEQANGTTAGLLSDSKTKQKAIKTGATLTLVLSVFLTLIVLWKMRPGATKTTTRRRRNRSNQPIPDSIVSVLGQLPFLHNQQLQLLRLGNRLLLVSVSANGSQTLGEINDPNEVREIEHAFETGQFDQLADRFQDMQQPVGSQANIQTPTGLSLGSRPHRNQYSTTGRTLLEA